MSDLLTRDDFREGVFARDGHACVICGEPAQDAHHVIERRLFPDGGYYLDNGASLCGAHHVAAETTELSCEEVRRAAGIERVVLPPHLYSDQEYDKWGNPVLANGQRLKGDLFWDESVQKILAQGGALRLFSDYVKYPRTYHLPWSPSVGKDDRVLADLSAFEGREVVVTEKMDGENTTMYSDYIHARSVDGRSHPTRGWVKRIHAEKGWQIPAGWRVCGENLYARHSIAYDGLPSYFLLFSVWDERNECLSWDETVEWAALLDFQTVPVLYRGPWDEQRVREVGEALDPDRSEGYVVRVADPFSYGEFRSVVGKYVREGHVHTHGQWMREAPVPNGLA